MHIMLSYAHVLCCLGISYVMGTYLPLGPNKTLEKHLAVIWSRLEGYVVLRVSIIHTPHIYANSITYSRQYGKVTSAAIRCVFMSEALCERHGHLNQIYEALLATNARL